MPSCYVWGGQACSAPVGPTCEVADTHRSAYLTTSFPASSPLSLSSFLSTARQLLTLLPATGRQPSPLTCPSTSLSFSHKIVA